ITSAFATYAKQRSEIVEQGLKDLSCELGNNCNEDWRIEDTEGNCSNDCNNNGGEFHRRRNILNCNLDIVTKFLSCSLYDLKCNNSDSDCCSATARAYSSSAVAAVTTMVPYATISNFPVSSLDKELKCAIK